jgi:hypothetical protein
VSELTKQFDSFHIISVGGLIGSMKSSDEYERILETYTRSPFLSRFEFSAECYAFVLSALLCLFMVSTIGEILTDRAWTKVFIPIVKAITINVVNMWAITADYFSVHTGSGFSVLVNRIPFIAASVKVSLPSSVRQSTVTTLGYDCVLVECQPNIPTRLAVNVYDFFSDLGMLQVPSTPSTKLRPLCFKGSTFRAVIILVGALLCWCKIEWWLGYSYIRTHILSATEMCGRATTEIIIHQMEAV